MSDDLRMQLDGLVRQLLEEGEEQHAGEPIGPLLREHLGGSDRELPVLNEALDNWAICVG